jgi:hypothetical protein
LSDRAVMSAIARSSNSTASTGPIRSPAPLSRSPPSSAGQTSTSAQLEVVLALQALTSTWLLLARGEPPVS